MTPYLLVVDNPDRWPLNVPGVTVVGARRYLTSADYATPRAYRVLNMCRSYRYQSVGYYVSLLAEARGHRPIPSTGTIQDLKTTSLIRSMSADIDKLIQQSLAPLQSDNFTLSIYFGRNLAKRYDRLSRQLFNLFPAPLLRAEFQRSHDGWSLRNIFPIATSEVPDDHRIFVVQFAEQFFADRSHTPRVRKPSRFHLALLVDPHDHTPPSDEKAIRGFEKAAESMDMSTERLTREDYGRIVEFDGLFIRSTTAVNDYTYRFARRAEAEGLVTIDDPESIMRCTNKVFLAELLERHKIPAPRTIILHKDNIEDVLRDLGLPCILKQPDSSFSQGVVKASTREQFLEHVARLLDKSELLIAQEYLPTDFDWRIGIIDGQALYACKYYMARGHWQIYDHSKKGAASLGNSDTLPVELVPRKVLRAAMKAAELIGNGLYGVDLKEKGDQIYVIEVNDNPSIEHGLETAVLRDQLYQRIMSVFLKRLEQQRLFRP